MADKAQLIRAMAARSCAFYAQSYLSGPPESPYNGRFLVSEHHQEWSDILNDRDPREKDFICVLAARDSGKSAFFSLAYPIWQIDRHPGDGRNNYGVIFSSKQDQASRILLDVLAEVESNPNLAHLLPEKRGRNWGGTFAKFANGHRLYARGYGVRVRGMHPKYVILDDVLNDSTDLVSEVGRRRNISYYYSAIEPMVVPGGQVVVVGTPFHKQDLYNALSEDNRVRCYRYPAIREDGRALWPERYSIQALQRIRSGMPPVVFSREYLCEPVAEGATLFPEHLFHNSRVARHDVVLGREREYWEKEHGIQTVFMGVDFALSANVGADYTVLFVVGVDQVGNRWVIDIVRQKGMEFQNQLQLIKNIGRRYRCDSIYLESNQAQRIFGDELIRTTDLPIKNVQTGEEKHSVEKGVPSLRRILENEKFRIPRGDDRSKRITDIWIDEMQSFTFDGGRVVSVGSHDDTVMALYVCDKAIREGSFSFTFGPQPGDEEAFQEETGYTLDPDMLLMDGAYRSGDIELDAQLDEQLRQEGLLLSSRQGGDASNIRAQQSVLEGKEIAADEDATPPPVLKPSTAKGGHMRDHVLSATVAKPAKEVLRVGGAPTAGELGAMFGHLKG